MLHSAKFCLLKCSNYQCLTSRLASQSYYETLKIKEGCSDKEVRDAFVKLSKKHHPDTSSTANVKKTTAQFTAIMEAYKVLSRAESRAAYDHSRRTIGPIGYQLHRPWQQHDSGQYGTKTGYSNSNAPYGIRGIKRISNIRLVTFLAMFASVGFVIQMWAIRNSFTSSRDKLDDISAEAGQRHGTIRAEAEMHGNEKQLEIVKARLQRPQY